MADRAPNCAVLLLAGTLTAAGLAGCEYADDVGPAPSAAAGRTGSGVASTVPAPSVDPEHAAELDRNMGAVELMLADVPVGAGGGTGSISGRSGGGGLMFHSYLTRAGTYTVSAVCVGTPDAQLTVISLGTQTFEHFPTLCGEVVSHQIELGTGQVELHLVRDEGSGARTAAGGVRISDPTP
jgi:hypothetical protein